MSDISLNAYDGMNPEPKLYFSHEYSLREWPGPSVLNFPGRIISGYDIGKRMFVVCQTDKHDFHYEVTKRRKHLQKHFLRKDLRPASSGE